MTRKDYQKFADAFNVERDRIEKVGVHVPDRINTLRRLASEAAVIFANDNDRFDVKKFYTACGLEVL